jgi:hypothetical protein
MSMIEMNRWNLSGIQALSLDRVNRSSTGSAGEAPQPTLAPPAAGATASPMVTISSLQSLESTFAAAMASGDPALLMNAIATRIRRSNDSANEAGITANETLRAERAERQMAAFHKAAEEARSAETWGIVAKVGAYVAAAVSVAVGVCGSVFSGGTSLAAGIGLAVLCVSAAATVTFMMAQDLHAFGDQGPPKWLGWAVTALALVAAVCSGGAGVGGALGAIAGAGSCLSVTAQTASLVVDAAVNANVMQEPPPWIRTTLRFSQLGGGLAMGVGGFGGSSSEATKGIVDGARSAMNAAASAGRAVAEATEAVGMAGGSVANYRADEARIESRRIQRQMARIDEQTDDLIEGLRQAGATLHRAQQRASEVLTAETRTRATITRNFGRA